MAAFILRDSILGATGIWPSVQGVRGYIQYERMKKRLHRRAKLFQTSGVNARGRVIAYRLCFL